MVKDPQTTIEKHAASHFKQKTALRFIEFHDSVFFYRFGLIYVFVRDINTKRENYPRLTDFLRGVLSCE